VLTRQIPGDDFHVGACLLDADTGAQPCDTVIAEIQAVFEFFGRVVERRPQLELAGGVVEAGGHDTGNFMRPAVELNLPADDRGVTAESALPKIIAEYGDTGGAVGIELLLLREGASDQRLHPQSGEERGGGARALETLGFAGAGEIEVPHGAG